MDIIMHHPNPYDLINVYIYHEEELETTQTNKHAAKSIAGNDHRRVCLFPPARHRLISANLPNAPRSKEDAAPKKA